MGSCLTRWFDSHAGFLPPTSMYVPQRFETPLPIALMGCLPLMDRTCCSQGGGVYIASGTVSFDACNIYENSGDYVSVRCSNTIPHRPDGVLAFHLTGWLLAGRRCLHRRLKYPGRPGRLPKLQHILQHRKSSECWLCGTHMCNHPIAPTGVLSLHAICLSLAGRGRTGP